MRCGDSVMLFLDFYMLGSDKNSRQIVFLFLLEKPEDFSYSSGNLGRTPLGVTTCLRGQA